MSPERLGHLVPMGCPAAFHELCGNSIRCKRFRPAPNVPQGQPIWQTILGESAQGKRMLRIVKQGALKVPAIRRLYDQRNEYARELEEIRRALGVQCTHDSPTLTAIQERLAKISPATRVPFLKGELETARKEAYPPHPYNHGPFDYDWFQYASTTQSTIFYADMLPALAEWLFRQPRGSQFRMLDVGGSSGAGAEFLAKIFWTMFTGYKITVDVLDIESTYKRLSPMFNDHITYKVGDIFAVADGAYDICICSHTIEHIPKDLVGPFIRKVIGVSSQFSIFNAPYMESPTLPGHLYTVDKEFLSTLPVPTTKKIYRSLGWYRENQLSECIVFTYERVPSGPHTECKTASSYDESLIWRVVMQDRSVDLVKLGPYMNIIHCDDEMYKELPAQHKNQTIYDLAQHVCEPLAEVGDIRRYLEGCDIKSHPFRYLAAVFVAAVPNFCYCDIGANYGTTAMEMARFFRSLGAQPRQFAFEPGIASNVTQKNFGNNGFHEIEFHAAAVGPVDGFVVIHRELGWSADNRIVNPLRQRERGSMSFPVRCHRLDSFLKSESAFGPALVKIDTQGAEPGVLAGMGELLSSQPVAGMIEFTPDAIKGVIDPEKFVGRLLDTHYVFNLGVLDSELEEITRGNLQGLGQRVFNTPERWVDLMFVPKSEPGLQKWVEKLRGAQEVPPG